MNIDLSPPIIPDEFCDCCNVKINLQRVYYNGRKICPTCYTQQISQFQPISIKKCPKCGYQQENKQK